MPLTRQQRVHRGRTPAWLALVALALFAATSHGEEAGTCPSAEWAPSAAWSPRVAELPTHLRVAKVEQAPEVKPTSETEVFAAPALESDKYLTSPAPYCPRPQSYFLPSLCRYGLVAPAPHEPTASTTCPATNDDCTAIFAPPPCGGPPVAPAPPCIDQRAQASPYSIQDFSPDAFCDQPYNSCDELGIYGDKHLVPTQRPLIELGMPLYLGGPVPPPSDTCGPTNPSLPRFYLYGDYRAAAAFIDDGGESKGVLAHRLNLDWDLWLTSTERFHMSAGPLQRGDKFQRLEFND